MGSIIEARNQFFSVKYLKKKFCWYLDTLVYSYILGKLNPSNHYESSSESVQVADFPTLTTRKSEKNPVWRLSRQVGKSAAIRN